MIAWLRKLWWAKQRAIDMQVLWPACKANASSLDASHQAFMVHAIVSPCWVRVYEGKLWAEVRKLT